VLELYGSEKCCDGTSSWSFAVNDGDWLDYTVENFNKYRTDQTYTLQPFPLIESTFYAKTIYFEGNVVESFDEFL